MRHGIGRLVAALGLAALTTSAGRAQEVRVSALQAWPDHDLLGVPFGFGVAAGIRPLDRVGVRLGLEAYGDDFASVGSTCVGLVPPGLDCSDEPRREEADLRAVSLTVPLTLHAGGPLRLDALPAVRTAWIESDQLGLESGRRRSADKAVYGFEIGAEAAVRPVGGWPLGIHLSGHVGFLEPYREEIVADGYTPFQKTIGLARLQLGASLARWGLSPREERGIRRSSSRVPGADVVRRRLYGHRGAPARRGFGELGEKRGGRMEPMFLSDVERHEDQGSRGEAIRGMRAAGIPVPQILHLFAFKPDRTDHLARFTQGVMRGPSPLAPGQRELIAAFTSDRNGCPF